MWSNCCRMMFKLIALIYGQNIVYFTDQFHEMLSEGDKSYAELIEKSILNRTVSMQERHGNLIKMDYKTNLIGPAGLIDIKAE